MRRMSDNPPSRYPERPIADAEQPWFVAHVKPRMEKAVADDCVRKAIEYYLPMVTKVTRRKDNNKPRKSVLPLFPGYIVRGEQRDVSPALRNRPDRDHYRSQAPEKVHRRTGPDLCPAEKGCGSNRSPSILKRAPKCEFWRGHCAASPAWSPALKTSTASYSRSKGSVRPR